MDAPNKYVNYDSSQVPTYLTPSILVTLFCCLPVGIAAIIQAAQVNSKLQIGDYEGAVAASSKAKKLCWWSFGLGLGIACLWGLLIGIGILSESTNESLPTQQQQQTIAPDAQSQNPGESDDSGFIKQIEQQLQNIEQQSGHKMLRTPYIGKLSPKHYTERNLLINSRTPYAFVGVCDNDCRDLDLELYDENGNLIDKDFEDDDLPQVSVTADWTGTFKLKVLMENCAESYCYYGVGVFDPR